MITTPHPIAPQLGPLAAPSERDVVAAYPELRDHAPTLPWAAEALGLQPSRLVALAAAGELVVVPGPWAIRRWHAGLGYLLPAWQLTRGRQLHPAVPALIAAAAERGWTSLALHRYMVTPLADGGPAPADLLHAGEAERVLALLRDGDDAGRRSSAVIHGQRRGGKRRRRPTRRGARHRAGIAPMTSTDAP